MEVLESNLSYYGVHFTKKRQGDAKNLIDFLRDVKVLSSIKA